MQLLPVPYLLMTTLPGFWLCQWNRHKVWLWAVWFDPPFSVFSVSAPTESVEIVQPFVSCDVVFALVGLVPQVQLLEYIRVVV